MTDCTIVFDENFYPFSIFLQQTFTVGHVSIIAVELMRLCIKELMRVVGVLTCASKKLMQALTCLEN